MPTGAQYKQHNVQTVKDASTETQTVSSYVSQRKTTAANSCNTLLLSVLLTKYTGFTFPSLMLIFNADHWILSWKIFSCSIAAQSIIRSDGVRRRFWLRRSSHGVFPFSVKWQGRTGHQKDINSNYPPLSKWEETFRTSSRYVTSARFET